MARSRRPLRRVCLGGMAAAALTACANTTDPRQGGFLTGVANLSSGAYRQRIDEREAEAASLEAQEAALEARAAGIRREQQEVDAALAAARSDLARLEQQVAALRARYPTAPATGAERAKLAEAERGLASARSKAAAGGDTVRPTSDRAADVAELERLLARVGGLVAEISRPALQS